MKMTASAISNLLPSAGPAARTRILGASSSIRELRGGSGENADNCIDCEVHAASTASVGITALTPAASPSSHPPQRSGARAERRRGLRDLQLSRPPSSVDLKPRAGARCAAVGETVRYPVAGWQTDPVSATQVA